MPGPIIAHGRRDRPPRQCPVCAGVLHPSPSDRPGYACWRCRGCDRPLYQADPGQRTVDGRT